MNKLSNHRSHNRLFVNENASFPPGVSVASSSAAAAATTGRSNAGRATSCPFSLLSPLVDRPSPTTSPFAAAASSRSMSDSVDTRMIGMPAAS